MAKAQLNLMIRLTWFARILSAWPTIGFAVLFLFEEVIPDKWLFVIEDEAVEHG
ncbi:hypothetical protein IFT84_17505 [Rhizobium sp. CFBP 8762]|uniref:hypothetical protein n=1 Tax=Rhizobium sp. CFBP 8762 TaxID=2775279 RepID=UPI001783A579|nr:hypothetical protein [Rhizobium sp. CFBP 8762]MBD8556307.1 hypothetical protein [Rhizobium sp. CFBP 8762]